MDELAIDRLRWTIGLKLRVGRVLLKIIYIEGQGILNNLYPNSLGSDMDILGKFKGRDSEWVDSNFEELSTFFDVNVFGSAF